MSALLQKVVKMFDGNYRMVFQLLPSAFERFVAKVLNKSLKKESVQIVATPYLNFVDLFYVFILIWQS